MSNGVVLHVQDGGLGQSPPAGGNTLVVIGCHSGGTQADYKPYGTTSGAAIVANSGYGSAPELGASIAQVGNEVIFVGVPAATPGSNTAVNATVPGGGTSAVTLTGTPNDTYYGKVTVVVGGTIGTSGIQLSLSVDAGRTTQQTVNLGTASTAVFTNTGLTLNFGAGTLKAGDSYSWVSTEPLWSDAAVASAIASLVSIPDVFKDIYVTGGSDASTGPGTAGVTNGDVTALQTAMDTLFTKRRYGRLIACGRDALYGGNSTETEATWIAALQTQFVNADAPRVAVSGGNYNMTSAITQSQMRRPLAFFAAVRDSSVAIQVDLGRVSDGALSPMVVPVSPDGFIYHDESVNPGLDAARLISAWSITSLPGLYILNPNLLAAPGSDFNWLQHGAVIDAACLIAYVFFVKQLSSAVRVSKSTGKILEQDAKNLELRCNAQLDNGLVNANAVTDAVCVVSRADNLLTTPLLHVTISITPLAYLKAIDVVIQFVNPAIVVTA